jgi:hypothetical protein
MPYLAKSDAEAMHISAMHHFRIAFGKVRHGLDSFTLTKLR